MRTLCIARHPFLTEHLCRFFKGLGVETIPAVGVVDLLEQMERWDPDAVLCEYDLLSGISIEAWEADPHLSRIPLIAISFTRHPGDAHVAEIDGIAGFLYLPMLDRETARRILAALGRHRGGLAPNEHSTLLHPWHESIRSESAL